MIRVWNSSKVFRPVISLYPVQVMDDMAVRDRASVGFLPHLDMLANVASGIRLRVFGAMHRAIATLHHYASLPQRAGFRRSIPQVLVMATPAQFTPLILRITALRASIMCLLEVCFSSTYTCCRLPLALVIALTSAVLTVNLVGGWMLKLFRALLAHYGKHIYMIAYLISAVKYMSAYSKLTDAIGIGQHHLAIRRLQAMAQEKQ